MKKLITIILVLALLLPAAALAADPDPIVGYWYMYYDGVAYPEFVSNFGNYDSFLDLYFFAEDGTIMLLENAIKDGSATPTFTSCGKWEKKLFSYNFSIIGIGDGTIELNTDTMKIAPSSYNGIKMVLRKIIPFNPYKDILY